MNIKERLSKGLLFFDGGTGTVLQSMGLAAGEKPEKWNITDPDKIIALHRMYFDAGANIVKTNTFGANRYKYSGQNGEHSVSEIISAALNNAKAAAELCSDLNKEHYVALDVGPLGKLLKPYGDTDFEEAVCAFSEMIKCGASCGADLILIETMNDAYEMKAAILAAKESCTLPIFATNVYDSNMRLLTGADPLAMISLYEGMGVDAFGMNCSLGPKQMMKIVPILYQNSHLPIIVNPNAGLPHTSCGRTEFDISADEFAFVMKDIIKSGATVVGGCCGTTPEYIEKMVETVSGTLPALDKRYRKRRISSYNHALEINDIDITSLQKISIESELNDGNFEYIVDLALDSKYNGEPLTYLFAGDDANCQLEKAVYEIQSVSDNPLLLSSSNICALEKAMRIYNGIPAIEYTGNDNAEYSELCKIASKYGAYVRGSEGIKVG